MKRYEIKSYYNKRCLAPRIKGALAIHSWHDSQEAFDTEIANYRQRHDIGRLEVWEIEGNKITEHYQIKL